MPMSEVQLARNAAFQDNVGNARFCPPLLPVTQFPSQYLNRIRCIPGLSKINEVHNIDNSVPIVFILFFSTTRLLQNNHLSDLPNDAFAKNTKVQYLYVLQQDSCCWRPTGEPAYVIRTMVSGMC